MTQMNFYHRYLNPSFQHRRTGGRQERPREELLDLRGRILEMAASHQQSFSHLQRLLTEPDNLFHHPALEEGRNRSGLAAGEVDVVLMSRVCVPLPSDDQHCQ